MAGTVVDDQLMAGTVVDDQEDLSAVVASYQLPQEREELPVLTITLAPM